VPFIFYFFFYIRCTRAVRCRLPGGSNGISSVLVREPFTFLWTWCSMGAADGRRRLEAVAVAVRKR